MLNSKTAWTRLVPILSILGISVISISLVGCNGGAGGLFGGPTVTTPAPEPNEAELLQRLERKFENPEAHFLLGRLYHKGGRYSRAEYHYEVALSFDPAHRRAQAGLVKLLRDRGETVKAEQRAAEFIGQVAGSAQGLLELGAAFESQQLDEQALRCYQRALGLEPQSAEVHKALGYYYLRRDNIDSAKEHFSRSFQLNPNQPDVAGELGRMGVEVRIPRKAKPQAKPKRESAVKG